MYHSFLRENGGLFLFCSWMSHREIGMAADERIVLWDQSIISKKKKKKNQTALMLLEMEFLFAHLTHFF